MSNSVQPHRRQPTRLLCPWDSPGKNTGVGGHFLLQCMKMKSESETAQSSPTLHDPMDFSLPGPSVHVFFQARVPEWRAMSFSPTCHRATKLVCHNYWACALEPGNRNYWAGTATTEALSPWSLCFTAREATAMRSLSNTIRTAPTLCNWRQPAQKARPSTAKNK